MVCPSCLKNYNQVENSRDTSKGMQIWRRRKCLSCKHMFTTYEVVNMAPLIVEKKNKSVERFNHSKLFAGIFLASVSGKNADKGKSAVFSEKIATLVQSRILGLKQKVITTNQIRDFILEILVDKNPQVYLHFLAYVKHFPTREAIKRELQD